MKDNISLLEQSEFIFNNQIVQNTYIPVVEQQEELLSYYQFFRNQLVIYLRETLDHILLVVFAYTLLCLVLYKLLFHRCSQWLTLFRKCRLPPHANRALLVTAHPDDECMFFGPTILELRRRNCRIFLLCLSEGNYGQRGDQRRQELWDACESLGIKPEDITLLNATHLRDDPALEWKAVTIANQILKYLESLEIDLMVTFDKDGISGHPNHSAIYYATASLCLSGLIPYKCKVLTLETVNICRKYISVLDLPLTLLLSTNWAVLNWQSRRAVQNAMRLHRSQMVWFRKLYIMFSRYMVINSLREINKSDVEFEILDS
ncbi:N-acetylglucosaminyl-phosphatidylinositol de-N-acetylase [Wyeomyia smithii]|uniref:N-acetylglucosaminyl-phosphatidylinositol de-N-acetylase n=1 Tax=Wyeomyia smithii TaxID=174621 RepID=UPI0024680A28|nr:N-acetylglucosaminyl-phosphatidylinositol de-N-acetylase [Wyeomyia smithii]